MQLDKPADVEPRTDGTNMDTQFKPETALNFYHH